MIFSIRDLKTHNNHNNNKLLGWGGACKNIVFRRFWGFIAYMFIFIKLRSNQQADDEHVHHHIKCHKPQCILNDFSEEEN